MLERIKNKISENSGLVNMAINLAILYLLFTVATGIKSVDNKVTHRSSNRPRAPSSPSWIPSNRSRMNRYSR